MIGYFYLYAKLTYKQLGVCPFADYTSIKSSS